MNNLFSGDGLLQILDKHKPLLDHYGIMKIESTVVGGGDSGDISELDILFESEELNKTFHDERNEPDHNTLMHRIEDMIFEMTRAILPGWENNDGSNHVFSIDMVKRKINVVSTLFSTSEYNLLVPHALISQDVGVEEAEKIRIGRLSEVNPELYRFCVDNHIMDISGQILGVEDGEEPGFWQIQLMFDQNVKNAETAFMEKHTQIIPWPTPEDIESNQSGLDLKQLAAYKVRSFKPFFQIKGAIQPPSEIVVHEDISVFTKMRFSTFDSKLGKSVFINTLHVGPKLLQPISGWIVEQLKEKLDAAKDGWPENVDTEYPHYWVVVDAVNDEIRIGAIGNRQLSETFKLCVF